METIRVDQFKKAKEQPPPPSRPFKFLSNAEFEALSADEKAAYLRKAMFQLAVQRSGEAH